LTGDYLFDPQPGVKYDKDDDHVAQIMELLGEMPKALALSGKYSHEMFNRRGKSSFGLSFFVCIHAHTLSLGELRHINRLRLWPLMSVLKEKYLMEASEAETLSSFLMPMLHYYPDSRASAAELVNHPWLNGVVVQGELEMEERKRAGAAVAGAAAQSQGQGNGNGEKEKEKDKVPFEEIAKLGPKLKGMVGMGRI
jgi:serine/threonine-protein kinase SRPK3